MKTFFISSGVMVGLFILIFVLLKHFIQFAPSDKFLKIAPELQEFPADERNQIWFDAIIKASIPWPNILKFTALYSLSIPLQFFIFSSSPNFLVRAIIGLLIGASINLIIPVVREQAREYLRDSLRKD